MKRTCGMLLALFVGSPSLAQESAEWRACDAKAGTQYRAVLKAAADEPSAMNKIIAAERTWIAYRDAYIAAAYPADNKLAEYGTVYPMNVSLLRAKLTKRQVTALQELITQYTGARKPQPPPADTRK